MHSTKITLTHLNIRQSIVILLAKLVAADLLLAFIIISFYFLLVQGEQFLLSGSSNTLLFLITFSFIGIIKITLSIYVVLQWLCEYYELTIDCVFHKRGILFKKTEKYNLDKIRALKIEKTFLGEICNFATITLYDLRMNKYLDMYLIHNPDRYVETFQILKPNLEIKTNKIMLPFKKN